MQQIDRPQEISLKYDSQGLIPALAQDWRDGTVLMVGFMNEEAVTETFRTGQVYFWSRSRQTLWRKGETSGNTLLVKQVFIDCDCDTLLVKVEPAGPTCHTGNLSCFFQEWSDMPNKEQSGQLSSHGGIFERLYEMTLDRKQHPREDSYVSSLLTGGRDRILKKISEEAGEVLLAAKNDDRGEIIYEVADLFFHTMVLLGDCGISPRDITQELGKRYGHTGMKKKPGAAPHE